MEIDAQQADRIEKLLAELEVLDPAEVPEAAAELASILGEILERTDASD
jgi:hypothetical protein